MDTAHHVITDIKAYHANKKDSQCLKDIVERLYTRLWKFRFVWEDLLADTGYSSGEVYAIIGSNHIVLDKVIYSLDNFEIKPPSKGIYINCKKSY